MIAVILIATFISLRLPPRSKQSRTFESTRAVLRRYLAGRTVPFAITEFAPLFTIGKSSDGYIGTITGAIYVADLLRLFALSDDVELAAYWSLSGNWEFGALTQAGEPRPTYLVLRAYSRLLRGNLLPTAVDGPSFSSPRVGFTAAQSGVPTIAALAMREGNAANIILINKEPDERAELSVMLKSVGQLGHVSRQELSADGLFIHSKGDASVIGLSSTRNYFMHTDGADHSL
ncbi:MAG: hypothetical protein ACREYF_02910 [Gammaproteobacteria bacterium]